MKFKLIDGQMSLVSQSETMEVMRNAFPLSTAYIVDIPSIKESVKSGNFLKNRNFAGAVVTKGVFWGAFLTYIFPWMLDIAKVYCAIRICQAFYQENRGGKDSGTGFGALVTYGKWYLVFWLIPWGVELIDQIGGEMFKDLHKPIQTIGR